MGGAGFAKSRPAVQRSATHGPASARRSTARDGQSARGPVLISTGFCSAVTPRTCTDLHRVWACTRTTVSLNLFTIKLFELFDNAIPLYQVLSTDE